MSPRAACRLEGLGFHQVYDYVLGIADWKAAGLPLEGTATDGGPLRVADATRPDIPTCAPGETIGEVRSRTLQAEWDEALVIDCGAVVVGRLRGQAWEADPATPVEEAMEPGPTTVRPRGLLQPLLDRMTARGTNMVVVTTAQGTLLGVLLRRDAERLVSGEPPEQIWQHCEGCPGQWRP